AAGQPLPSNGNKSCRLREAAPRCLVHPANTRTELIMNRLADLILSHQRLVVAFWAVVTAAAFAAVGPAGGSLSQQFNIPGREGYETNKDIAEIYGSGGRVAPLVSGVPLPRGTAVYYTGRHGEAA